MSFQIEKIKVKALSSGSAFNDLIFITVESQLAVRTTVDVTIGSVNQKSINRVMRLGQTVIYDCGSKGKYEIRLLERSINHVLFAVSRLDKIDLFNDADKIHADFVLDTEAPDNDSFSKDDISILKEKLARLEQIITEKYAKNEQQEKFIHSQISYLIEAVERQGKKDWMHTAIGVFMTIAIAVGISAAESNSFWQIIKSVLGKAILLLVGN